MNAARPGGEEASQTSLLQRRAAAQKASAALPTSPNIHIHVPDMSKLFQPAAAASPLAPATAPLAPALPIIQTIFDNPLLVPAHAMAQPAIPLNEFALRFEFSDNIHNMLQGEGFTSSNQLHLISLQELRDMGLKRGEIAVLQEAAGIHWPNLVFAGPVRWTGKMTEIGLNPTAKDRTTGCGCTNSEFFRLPVAMFVEKSKNRKKPV